jgi:hypothetical protein
LTEKITAPTATIIKRMIKITVSLFTPFRSILK